MAAPFHPAPQQKPFADIAADIVAAALHGQSIEISEENGDKIAKFFKAILAGISK
jgi:hypothetical protein